MTTNLTGARTAEFRLTWQVDEAARNALEARVFGKRILFTNRKQWSPAQIMTAYRSHNDIEASFRQMKDTQVVSFTPMLHFTDQKIRVPVFMCVTALTIAQLMRRAAEQAGLHISVRELLHELGSIEETALLYHDATNAGLGQSWAVSKRPRCSTMMQQTPASGPADAHRTLQNS